MEIEDGLRTGVLQEDSWCPNSDHTTLMFNIARPLRPALTQVYCSPKKPVQLRHTKFLQPCPTLHEVNIGGNGVRETSMTNLPWMIVSMSTRTHWLGNSNWPGFKSGACLDTNVLHQLQQKQCLTLLWYCMSWMMTRMSSE